MTTTEKELLQDKVQAVIQKDSSVPVFSTTALKLLNISNKEDLDMETVAEIVKLDPGLTTKYLKLANSVTFGGQSITSVRDSLVRVGMNEVRKLASSIGVMEVLVMFRPTEASPKKSAVKKPKKTDVEWEMFWLHSLLTARLTDAIAGAYRSTTGKEYLAGLLHDVGKLFMERYFSKPFHKVISAAVERNSSMFEMEQQLLDTNHAQIGSLLCEKWGLHSEIVRAIRFHHQPTSDLNKDPDDPENEQFLAICVCIADLLANMCKANIPGSKDLENIECESLPQWKLLSAYKTRHSFEIDVLGELQKAQEAIEVLSVE
jgi:putative nucleotidyltransferase with HDIG domain